MFRLKCAVWSLLFSSVYSDQCHWQYTVSLECDVSYGNTTNSPTLNNVRSITECSELCSGNDGCLSVKFDHEQHNCQFNSERFRIVGTGVCSPVLKYASLIKRSCGKLVYQECAHTFECSTVDSNCQDGICMCRIGFSYNYGTESCDLSCDIYGDTFTSFEGYRIIENDHTYFQRSASTSHACESACVNEAAFLCLSFTFDTFDNVCVLHPYNINNAQLGIAEDFYYYHRHCQ